MRFVKPKLYKFENQLYHYVKECKKLRLFEKLMYFLRKALINEYL